MNSNARSSPCRSATASSASRPSISGAKVLLYDLSQSAPLIRIGCLLILGVSLYLGGWLYRKVGELENAS